MPNKESKQSHLHLQIIDPDDRLGAKEKGGYNPLKAHSFFEGIEWNSLPNQQPPELVPYLPAKDETEEALWGNIEVK